MGGYEQDCVLVLNFVFVQVKQKYAGICWLYI